MTEEKQIIEEMAKVIASVPPIEFPIGSRMQGKHIYTATKIAEHLYNADYRKQSEPISCDHEKGGEWIVEEDDNGYDVYRCSKCHCENVSTRNYCPECGAKMKNTKN